MFEIFASLFDTTLVSMRLTPPEGAQVATLLAYTIFNTALRAAVLGGFVYGTIRVVATAISHGSF